MVLDLFASSGQMGLEMLSRGASGCVFVDRNPEAAALIRRNLHAVARGTFPCWECAGAESGRAGLSQPVRRTRFDIAFSIPPMRRVFWSRPCGKPRGI